MEKLLKKAVISSKKLNKAKDSLIENDSYLLFFDGGHVKCNELVPSGYCILVSEKKAGTVYLDANNVEQKVRKDGFNFNSVVGSVASVDSIRTMETCLKEWV